MGKLPIWLVDRIHEKHIANDQQYRIDCTLQWAEGNPITIQKILNSYIEYSDKVVFCFLIGDIETTFNIPENVRLYRTSLLKSKQVRNEFVLPYIWEFLERGFEPLERTDMPHVGFCGMPSHYRKKTLDIFKDCNKIQTNYIYIPQFHSGHVHNETVAVNNDTSRDFSQRFYKNIEETHFTVCNRGNGNFSMRFYQTLSCGRIPILLDTDTVLPFSDEIAWEEIIVIAENEEKLLQRVFDYWAKNDIVAMQKKCRDIYETYFMGTRFIDKVIDDEMSIVAMKKKCRNAYEYFFMSTRSRNTGENKT